MRPGAAPSAPWQRLPEWVLDAVLVVVLVAASLLTGAGWRDHPTPDARLVALVLLVPQTVPLLARRRWPGAVLVVVAAATGVRLPMGLSATAAGLGVVVAIYSVAVYGTSKTRTFAWVVTGVLFAAALGAFLMSTRLEQLYAIFLPAAALLLAMLLGDHLRTRRAYTAALEERAARLERDRHEQAQAAVAAERTRIARELHDILAHHVSAIAVQAQAAQYTSEPTQVRHALRGIQRASDQVLAELRQLLGLLRDEPAAFAPPPGLAQVEDLFTAARAAGLIVRIHRHGSPRTLPQALDLSAYRILQEALTNVRTHSGADTVSVSIAETDGTLELSVVDNGHGPTAGDTAGRGLLGMRERVAIFGGRFEAGAAEDGGYRVHAVLPIQEAGCPSAS